MSLRISRNLSLFNENEVKAAFQNARHRIKVSGLKVFMAPRILEFGRILVVTPKKVGNSPKRNLIRRRLKSIFYENEIYQLPYDWIVLTSKEALSLPFEQLKKIIIDVAKENI